MHKLLPVLRIAAILLLAILPGAAARAQRGAFCPQNTSFELGNLALWTCDTGHAAPAAASAGAAAVFGAAASGVVVNRHTITSATSFDKYGGFPYVAPGGGQYSVRLGNDSGGGQAERIRYLVHVPRGYHDYSLQYQYAAVLNDSAGSTPGTKPSFRIAVLDSATGLPIGNGCTGQTLTVGGVGPAFQQSTVAPFPKYIPWTSGTLNLSGQAGKTVIIEVTSVDGSSGTQFSYGYFDIVSCGRFKAEITFCNLDRGDATMQAPPGYASYTWYRGGIGTGTPVAGARTFHIFPLPTTPTVFYCVVTPFAGAGCNDTLESDPMSDFKMRIVPDIVCQNFFPAQVYIQASGGLDTFSYSWLSSLAVVAGPDPLSGILNAPYVNGGVTIRPSALGDIVCIVTDTIGCYHMDTVRFQTPKYQVNLGPDTTICLGMSLDLKPAISPASSQFSYTWSSGRSLNDSTSLNPRFTPSAAGVESLTLRVDTAYCSVIDTIRIRTLPNSFQARDTAVCRGAVFTAGVFTDPLFQDSLSFSWSPETNLMLGGNGRQPRIQADSTISYVVRMSYPGCPDVHDTLDLRVEPVPAVNLGADSLMKCFGDTLLLSASVTPSWFRNYSFSWGSHTGLDSLSGLQARFGGNNDVTIVFAVHTPLGCRGADAVYIDTHPRYFGSLSPGDTVVCPGDMVAMRAAGGVSYRWTPGALLSDSLADFVTTRVDTPIAYRVYITDDIGCVDTLGVLLGLHPRASVALPDTQRVVWGQPLQLSPLTNGSSFNWSPATGLSDPEISDPVARPDSSQLYVLEVATGAGCRAVDSVYILVQSAVHIANAFAPGNGINPQFRISHTGIAALKHFRIYNRWGNLVFETTDISQGWDGRFNGELQPMGVYLYIVEATGRDGATLRRQGNVTLIR